MIEWLKTKFRKHRYICVGTSSTGGADYKCAACKRRLYVPLGFSYMIDVKSIKGCKGK